MTPLLLTGVVLTTALVWAGSVIRRRHSDDMGWMSEQWLAEYRARNAA